MTNKILILTTAVFCIVVSLADRSLAGTMLLPLPDYDRNYTNSSQTRGYWFTAPTDFTITGLNVPTDVGMAPQNIEVLRLNIVPPAFPNTTNSFTPLAYFSGINSTSFIPTNIDIFNGDIIGILGARGTTTMNNSYSAVNTFDSSIDGFPVTLKRLIFQGNLNAGQATAVSTTNGGPLSRVELQYESNAVPEPSTVALFGLGAVSLVGYRRRNRK